jgi:arylsulfatase A-like enzyme
LADWPGWSRGGGASTDRFAPAAAPALAFGILILLLGCRGNPSPTANASTPSASAIETGQAKARSGAQAAPAASIPRDLNVLLITVDALRADMPWVGYPRPIAPNLTALAKHSVVYTRAYALSSYTSMSLGGFMAGRYPLELPRDGRTTSRFFDEALFLAEILGPAKIRTLGIHGHVYFVGDTGIRQGFEDWRAVPRILLSPAREGFVTDDKLADLAITALDEHAKQHPSRRFFLWAHFMDPHFDYAAHPGQPRFRGAPYALDGGVPVAPGVPLSEIGQRLRDRYDGEVLFTDSQIGRLLAHVEKQPWASRTAIVVSSDHGEAFGEQKSYFEHGFFLYEVTTRVPLLFKIPGVPARRIDTARSHIDLARTLLELMGVPAPASLRGRSLVPELLGAPAEPRDVVIDMPYTDQTPRRRALIHGRYKIIESESETTPPLFDLETDPGEQRNIAAEQPEVLKDMQRRLRELDGKVPDYPAERRGRRQY